MIKSQLKIWTITPFDCKGLFNNVNNGKVILSLFLSLEQVLMSFYASSAHCLRIPSGLGSIFAKVTCDLFLTLAASVRSINISEC